MGKMHVNLLPIHIFISITFFTAGAFMYFLPRNPIFGMRSKYTVASNALWSKYNKISGAAISGLGALMFACAANGRPLDSEWVVFSLAAGIAALFFFSKRDYEKAKSKGLTDFDSDVPQSGQPKTKLSQKVGGFTFSKENGANVFYCLFCAFLIFVFYAWFRHVSGFMPQKVVSHVNSSGVADGVVSSGDLFFALNTLFGVVLVFAVLAGTVFAKFFKGRATAPFSLKTAPICAAVAVATLCCGLIAQINYLICAVSLPSFDLKDFSLCIFWAYCASFGAIAILIAASERGKKIGSIPKNEKSRKKRRR